MLSRRNDNALERAIGPVHGDDCVADTRPPPRIKILAEDQEPTPRRGNKDTDGTAACRLDKDRRLAFRILRRRQAAGFDKRDAGRIERACIGQEGVVQRRVQLESVGRNDLPRQPRPGQRATILEYDVGHLVPLLLVAIPVGRTRRRKPLDFAPAFRVRQEHIG